eukprot:4607284-Amphidinium_carterae.1
MDGRAASISDMFCWFCSDRQHNAEVSSSCPSQAAKLTSPRSLSLPRQLWIHNARSANTGEQSESNHANGGKVALRASQIDRTAVVGQSCVWNSCRAATHCLCCVTAFSTYTEQKERQVREIASPRKKQNL